MNYLVFLLQILAMSLMFCGCSEPLSPLPSGTGGGADSVTVDLPFYSGYRSQCVQGVSGSYSHHYNSTYYDLDLDTPNDRDDPVFAPVAGRAYVHNAGAKKGFGIHVTIDLGNGTYIILAHFKEVFVADGTQVARGQLLGYEGKTGNTTGDHVHMGRHKGDAKKDGSYGTSIEGLKIRMEDLATGAPAADIAVKDAVCDLSSGHVYRSALAAPLWHPTGSLIKTPNKSTVYRVSGTMLERFANEDAFLSRGYSWSDVALISDYEMQCYSGFLEVGDYSSVTALKDSHSVNWILIGNFDDPDRYRLKLNETGTVSVLASYGITVSSFEDVRRGEDSVIQSYPDHGKASYRDGTLVSPLDASDVYLIMDSAALPIDSYDTLLLLGFGNRPIREVSKNEITQNVTMTGNCATDTYCITQEDVTECHGQDEEVLHEEGTVSEPDDSGQGAGADSGDSGVDEQALVLNWKVPGGKRASTIALSGEFIHADGVSEGWRSNLANAVNAPVLNYERAGVQSGDSLRFSVEYTVDGKVNWSCVGPYPPGTVQGTIFAEYGGTPLTVMTAKDPGSDGCGLTVTMP